jgi:zinc transport system permease protein
MLALIYDVIEFLLPFQWVQSDFMKNALIAVILATPLFGLLGTMVVNQNMAFFSDSIGHSVFTGIAIGTLVGAINPVLSATVFSVLFAIVITWIKNRSRVSTDTIIGVFSSLAIALGIILLSLRGDFAKYSSYLVGDVLSISKQELVTLSIVFLLIVLTWIVIYNRLLLMSVNGSLARSRGVRTLPVELIFTSVIAVIVTISIQWIGLLIINSLLVLPAASSRNLARNVRQYTFISVGFALFSGVCGLITSYYLNTPTGATIIMISGVVFFLSFLFRSKTS